MPTALPSIASITGLSQDLPSSHAQLNSQFIDDSFALGDFSFGLMVLMLYRCKVQSFQKRRGDAAVTTLLQNDFASYVRFSSCAEFFARIEIGICCKVLVLLLWVCAVCNESRRS